MPHPVRCQPTPHPVVRPKSHPDRFEDLVLSRHFTDNWALRVGNQPSRPFIRHILKNAIRVQTGRMLRTGAGEPFSTLSIFWYPPLGVILTLDKFTQTAVSVLSADMNKPS